MDTSDYVIIGLFTFFVLALLGLFYKDYLDNDMKKYCLDKGYNIQYHNGDIFCNK